jgi:thioredoxin-related protein
MKKYSIYLLFGFILLIGVVFKSQLIFSYALNNKSIDNPGLKWYRLDDGLSVAAKEKKHVIIDVYTDWCGWCKTMDQKTYNNEKITDYLNKKFVLVKLNAESEEIVNFKGVSLSSRELAYAFRVTGYPTTIFLNSNSDVVTLVPGYIPPDDFMDIINYIGNSYYTKMSWNQYKGGSNK